LLDGQIQTAIAGADPQGEVYRELVLASCRFYHELLPNLFEALDDATELLLPDDLLTEGSITGGFRAEISHDDCQDVEVIGWLYQFYISDKKDEVMARKKAVPTEEIPAVTQLFTPHWIVRYLVENSLGRLWLLNRPSSNLREHMPYYIEGDAETDFLVINQPEEIKIMDPACGSGHMLTYAFDILALIYAEEGYAPSEIPGLILQHNLHGLEICPRAAQLAELALVLKAREHSRRFLHPEQLVTPHIIELQDTILEKDELSLYVNTLGEETPTGRNLIKVISQFSKAKTVGSLIKPCLDEKYLTSAIHAIERQDLSGEMFLHKTRFKILSTLKQAAALSVQYHVVVANPPYLGLRKMNDDLKASLPSDLEPFKWDLFSCFIARLCDTLDEGGSAAYMAPTSWMHLAAHEPLRELIRSKFYISSLFELGIGGFEGAAVQICGFTLHKTRPLHKTTTFIDLKGFKTARDVEALDFSLLSADARAKLYKAAISDFRLLPGGQLAYSLPKKLLVCFAALPPLGELATIKQGLATSDNARFLRYWHEISACKIDRGCRNPDELQRSAAKWFPFNKGGGNRKWYGNNDFVVNWENDGKEMKEFTSTLPQGTWVRLKSREYYCLPSITFSTISAPGEFSCRLSEDGFIFDKNGSCIFASEDDLLLYLAILNSSVAARFLGALCATLYNDIAGIRQIPIAKCSAALHGLARQCVEKAKAMWDRDETAYSFLRLPAIDPAVSASMGLREAVVNSVHLLRLRQHELQGLEHEIDLILQQDYDIEELNVPSIPAQELEGGESYEINSVETLSLLSYCIGCMMGRYSLDRPGLILADARDSQAEQLTAYEDKVGKSISEVQFKLDPDGIIPVLDGEWFEDDIVARTREFLEVTFPESSVTENLRFIEESLGKDVRKYFCSEFYKDHLQTYKKRPIYWMVQSPKKGFSCLIYLHRYTKDTLNQVLNNYFRPYLQKLEARLAQLGLEQLNDDLPTRERTAARKEAEKISKVLKECQAWEQDALLPLAQQRIELDLDDGVKVNYLKLQEVLATIPGLAAKED
jgi:hypothetical protein